MQLSLRDQHRLRQASSSIIEAEFAGIRDNWARSRWLLPVNHYAKNCVDKIEEDLSSRRGITHRHLRDYIAASSVVHCMDGWSYLGKAIESHLKGNPDIACHLGYYAELRAAMAILATEGIGVFNNIHIVVDRRGKCDCLRCGGTHTFAWDALEAWTTTSSAVDLIFTVIKPGGLPLRDWADRFPVPGGFGTILATGWLLQWGLDLQRLREDRAARNDSSYRPTAFSSSRAMPIIEALQFVKHFWEICEPTETIRFPILDRHLLRLSLECTFKAAHNRSRRQARRIYARQVQTMLRGLTPRDLMADEWENFLTFSNSPDQPLILQEARAKDVPQSLRHHIQVLARATLLLRIATGATQAKLESLPGFSRADLQFWWNGFGEDQCLWHSNEPPEHFTDLWTDVREAVQNIDSWQTAMGVGGGSYHKLWRENGGAVCVLGSCERVGLWGLGL